MMKEKRRTRAVNWNPVALPGPVQVGRGRRAVRLEVIPVGRDLLVTVTGGQAHVGAVAMACPGGGESPVCDDGLGGGLLVLPPHKEGPLAKECARLLAEAGGCVCVATAGIHQDGATREEIEAIVANARIGVRRLAAALAAVPPDQRYCRARLPKPSTP